MEDLKKLMEKNAGDLIEKKDNQDAEVFTYKPNEDKSLKDQAKDFVGTMAVSNAVKDEKLVEDLTEKAKEELKENATANLKEEKAKSKQADITLQSAEYGVFEGVATYAGIKKPLPKKMQAILFSILCGIQTIVLIVFGTPVSIVNILLDCADSIVKKMSSVAKSAVWLVVVVAIGIAIAITLIVLKNKGVIP